VAYLNQSASIGALIIIKGWVSEFVISWACRHLREESQRNGRLYSPGWNPTAMRKIGVIFGITALATGGFFLAGRGV
jgi:hypothetical protein